jgi:solute carrier family 25 protein 38
MKVRFESDIYAYRSLAGAAGDIYRRAGVRGFFAGVGATAARDAPYAGLYVLFYEQCKRRLGAVVAPSRASQEQWRERQRARQSGGGRVGKRERDVQQAGMDARTAAGVNFASGVVAAGVATALTNPFDAIKTRLQLMPREYRGMWQAGRRIVREEGLRALMDGLGLRMVRKGLSSALAWTVYEEVVRRGRGGDAGG